MKRKGGLKIFACLLAGFLLCVMVTMMYIGRKVNFEQFTSAGQVYEFSQKQLRKSGKNVIYDQQAGGFWINGKQTVQKYVLNGKFRAWKCVYINLDNMSQESMQAGILYLDRDKKKIAEQPVVLVPGENLVFLDETIPMYGMGLRFYDAQNQFFSLESIQLRDEVSGFLPWRVAKILAISFCGFLMVFFACMCIVKMATGKAASLSSRYQLLKEEIGRVQSCLQYAYRLLAEDAGKWLSNKIPPEKRRVFRTILFSLLFLWMILADVFGWFLHSVSWKYALFVCCIFLWAIALLCWEGPRQAVNRQELLTISWLHPIDWRNLLAFSWFALWIGTMISDVTAKTRIHFVGYFMVFACGMVIYMWDHMERPSILLNEIMKAQEIIFLFAVIYLMVFRTKKTAIQYNGIFNSSEEFSAYALLMFSIFLVELDNIWYKRKKWFWYFSYMTGAGLSLFFVFRAGNQTGYAAATLLVLCFFLRIFLRSRKLQEKKWRLFFRGISAAAAACCVVCLVHVAVKYLPSYLNLEIEYQEEILLTSVPEEMMEAFNQLEPGLMEGVVQEDNIEVPVCQEAYLRKLSLFGRGEKVHVFRKAVPAYNGYLQIAYRYGVFILVPFILIQLCMLKNGLKSLKNIKKSGKDCGVWMLFLTIIYVCFSVRGNLEYNLFSPLWLCFYLGAGYWFSEG